MGIRGTARRFIPVPAETERIATEIVDAAVTVHRELGPGLYEGVYEACLIAELTDRGLSVERQVTLAVTYKGRVLDAALRLDLFVQRRVVVELKSVENLLPVHSAQLLTYLKLTGARVGLLINFHVPVVRQGIRRFIR